MPSKERRHEVCSTENVETPAKDGAGDAGKGGAVPGYLRAVDGEMRGDGAVETLFFEDGIGSVVFDGLGCGGSGTGG